MAIAKTTSILRRRRRLSPSLLFCDTVKFRSHTPYLCLLSELSLDPLLSSSLTKRGNPLLPLDHTLSLSRGPLDAVAAATLNADFVFFCRRHHIKETLFLAVLGNAITRARAPNSPPPAVCVAPSSLDAPSAGRADAESAYDAPFSSRARQRLREEVA